MAIDVRVYADEVTARISHLPRRLQNALRRKMENIFSSLEEDIFQSKEGRFISPETVKHGVEQHHGMLFGFFEAEDKQGVYSIFPVKAKYLINKKQDFFAREVHEHPFPKTVPLVERVLRDSKPWIVEQLKSAAKEI